MDAEWCRDGELVTGHCTAQREAKKRGEQTIDGRRIHEKNTSRKTEERGKMWGEKLAGYFCSPCNLAKEWSTWGPKRGRADCVTESHCAGEKSKGELHQKGRRTTGDRVQIRLSTLPESGGKGVEKRIAPEARGAVSLPRGRISQKNDEVNGDPYSKLKNQRRDRPRRESWDPRIVERKQENRGWDSL